MIKAVGIVSALNILARRAAGLARPTMVRLVDASRDKVMIRPTQSDLFAAAQVFGWQDYQLYRAISAKEVDTLVQGDVLVFLDSSMCSPVGNRETLPARGPMLRVLSAR